jgi:hypothetical protein
MPEPDPDPAFRIRTAILDAVDGLIRREAKALRPEELEAFVAERNRVAELLGRPRFTAVDLLVPGRDD